MKVITIVPLMIPKFVLKELYCTCTLVKQSLIMWDKINLLTYSFC